MNEPSRLFCGVVGSILNGLVPCAVGDFEGCPVVGFDYDSEVPVGSALWTGRAGCGLEKYSVVDFDYDIEVAVGSLQWKG